MAIVYTSKAKVRIKLLPEEIQPVQQALNLAIIGHKKCNKINRKTKEIIAKKMSLKKAAMLREAHWHIHASHEIVVTFDVLDTGQWINFRIGE